MRWGLKSTIRKRVEVSAQAHTLNHAEEVQQSLTLMAWTHTDGPRNGWVPTCVTRTDDGQLSGCDDETGQHANGSETAGCDGAHARQYRMVVLLKQRRLDGAIRWQQMELDEAAPLHSRCQ